MGRFVVGTALILLTACRLPGSAQGCDTVQIDWVDFIQVGSTEYVAGPGVPATLQESDLGPVVGQVKFRVDGNICDPKYKPKDGDAAFLEPGTPVYEVKGSPPSQVLAARRNGQILRYQAMAPAG